MDLEPFIGIWFYYCNIIFLNDFNFNSYCILSIRVTIFFKMNSYNFCNFFLVFFIGPQKILDVFVLCQREFSKRQNWTVKFQSVHLLCLNFRFLFIWALRWIWKNFRLLQFRSFCIICNIIIFELFILFLKFNFSRCSSLFL